MAVWQAVHDRDGRITPTAAAILAAALVCTAYCPLLTYQFGYLDDYAMLMVDGYRDSNPWLLASGRPAAGLLMALFFGWMTDIGDLAVARATTILQMAAAAALLTHALTPLTRSPTALAFSVAAFCTIPFQVMASWAVFAVQMPGLLLSLAIAPLAVRLAEDGPKRLVSLVGLVVGLLGALCFYQPYAAAYWIVLAALWLTTHDRRRIIRGMVLNLAVFGATNLLYVGLLRVVKTQILALTAAEHGVAAALTRGGLIDVQGVAAKVVWFVGDVLPRVLVPVQQTPGLVVIAVAAAAAAAGLWFGAPMRGAVPLGTRLAALCGWVLAAGVTASAILVSAESDLTFRTIGIPAAVAMLPMVFMVERSARRLRLEWLASIAILAVAMTIAWHGATTGLARPQAAEVDAVRARLLAAPAVSTARWALIAPNGDITRLPGTVAEIGLLSTATHWGAIGLVWLLLDEQGRAPALEDILYLPQADSPTGITFTRQGTFVVPVQEATTVDLRDLAVGAEPSPHR